MRGIENVHLHLSLSLLLLYICACTQGEVAHCIVQVTYQAFGPYGDLLHSPTETNLGSTTTSSSASPKQGISCTVSQPPGPSIGEHLRPVVPASTHAIDRVHMCMHT